MVEILSRQELRTGKIFANIVLTEGEVKKLINGKVITGEMQGLAVQIVGYGDETSKGGKHE